MNGRGIPMMGNRPMVMPMFMMTCTKMTPATPYAYILEKLERWRSAICVIRYSNTKNSPTTPSTPTNPCSSPTVQKMKSVLCSGTNLSLVMLPFSGPLPKSPPEPIAILECSRLYAEPRASELASDGFSQMRMRCCWCGAMSEYPNSARNTMPQARPSTRPTSCSLRWMRLFLRR